MPEPRPLIFQLYTTHQRAGRLVARALEGTGIRPEDAALYSVLDRHGPLTPSALADRLGIGPSTLTYRLKALEAAGILARRPNPDDGRSSLVELSPDGRGRWHVIMPTFAEVLRRAERRVELPQDEVVAALEAVAGAIDAELEAGEPQSGRASTQLP
jgi:DNA-binding MarR family transcriptional regulator